MFERFQNFCLNDEAQIESTERYWKRTIQIVPTEWPSPQSVIFLIDSNCVILIGFVFIFPCRLEERRKNNMQNEDVTSYLVRTLAWTKEQTSKYQIDYPLLFKVSASECSEIIDFLLNDASYTTDDINDELDILRCDLSEVKQRLGECKMMTFKPKLYLLRLSRGRYLTRMKNVSRDRVDGAAIMELIGKRVTTTKTNR